MTTGAPSWTWTSPIVVVDWPSIYGELMAIVVHSWFIDGYDAVNNDAW